MTFHPHPTAEQKPSHTKEASMASATPKQKSGTAFYLIRPYLHDDPGTISDHLSNIAHLLGSIMGNDEVLETDYARNGAALIADALSDAIRDLATVNQDLLNKARGNAPA